MTDEAPKPFSIRTQKATKELKFIFADFPPDVKALHRRTGPLQAPQRGHREGTVKNNPRQENALGKPLHAERNE